MGKEHDDWLQKLGTPPKLLDTIKYKKGNDTTSIKALDDGVAFTGGVEKTGDFAKKNFLVGPVPCYIKAGYKLAIEGELAARVAQDGTIKLADKVSGTVAGTVELGVGATVDGLTAGPFGAADLGFVGSITFSWTQGQGFDLSPFTIALKSTGKIGIKVEWGKDPNKGKVSAEAKLVDWELYIITCSGWQDGWFKSVTWKEGKDLQRLIDTLQKPGPVIEDAVAKYAPEAVKQAAVDAAKWAVESDDAKVIADTVEAGLKKFDQLAGVDSGARIEDAVKYLTSSDMETSTEATQRVEKSMALLNASGEQFAKAMTQLKLWPDQELGRYRSAEEWNKVQAALEADRDLLLAGKETTGQWVDLANALAATAAQRKKAAEIEAVKKKQQEQDALAAQAAADLARRVKEADDRADAALTAANMLGNPLQKKTKDNPGTKAHKAWVEGMNRYWSPGTAARLASRKLQGEARIAKANEAAELLKKAREVFKAGHSLTV